MFTTYFPYCDDGDYLISPRYHPSYNQQYHRQVERQRQYELERQRQLRLKEEHEQERKRQQWLRMIQQKQERERYVREQQQQRQRELEEDYRKRLLAAKKAMEEEKKQQQLEQAHIPAEEMRRRNASKKKVHYHLVNGPYGMLYRIPVLCDDDDDDDSVEKPTLQRSPSESSSESDIGSDTNVFDPREPLNETSDIVDEGTTIKVFYSANEDKETTDYATRDSSSLQMRNTQMQIENLERKSSPRTHKKKVPPSVIVEDASDSESEDDEFKSVWRNRRPSPGQWMEPIES